MSKEKTRAELHAEVARLKDDLQVTDSNLQNATIAHRELKEKYDALEKDRDEKRKESIEWQTKWDKLYKEKERESVRLNDCLRGAEDAATMLRADKERLAKRVVGLENEVMVEKLAAKRYSKDLAEEREARIALLEGSVFNYLVTKFRYLRNGEE